MNYKKSMKDKWFQWFQDNTPFSSFLVLIGMATIAAIIGIVLGHYFGNYDKPYRNFEDYQYQQYLNKDF